jgi:hypothetical protein
MNTKNDWMIAATLFVSLFSMTTARASEVLAKDCAVVSVQAPSPADYTGGSAGKAGINVGRGQKVGTGETSRAASSAMVHGDAVNADADDVGPSTERVTERSAKASTPRKEVPRN